MKPRTLELLFGFAALLLLGRVLYLYQPDLLLDDAFISFRFARNFADGLGLVYNPAERVEGYTNFLWTLYLGLAARLGVSIQSAAIIGGGLAALGSLFVLYLFGRRWLADHPGQAWLAGMPLLLFAGMGATARFVLSGIETLLFTFWICLGVYWLVYQPRPWLAGGVFGLAALTRPEGMLYFALGVGWALLWPGSAAGGAYAGKRLRLGLELLAGFGLLYLPYFAWRLGYYGYPLPNTYYAKAEGLNLERFQRGWRILRDMLAWWHIWPLILLSLSAFLPSRADPHARLEGSQSPANPGPGARIRPPLYLYLAVCLATFLYFIVVGGDFIIWFGPRFLMPALPFLLLLSAQGLANWISYLRLEARPANALAAGLALVLLAYNAWLSWPGQFERLEVFARQMRAWRELGGWMRANLPAGAWIAVDAAGLIPYYSGLPTIDMYGLTDAHIAHLELASPGAGIVAHEKFDPAYVLSRQPLCIVSTWIDSEGRPLSAGLESLGEQFTRSYQLRAVARSRGDGAPEDGWVLLTRSYSPELYAQGYLTGLFCRIDTSHNPASSW